jgi:hypothetical protein
MELNLCQIIAVSTRVTAGIVCVQLQRVSADQETTLGDLY